METVEGELVSHKVVGDDFWSIATVRTDDGQVAVTGKLLGVQVGDSVRCSGVWTEHPRFGDQFKASTCVVTIPQTDHGVIAWLAGGHRFQGIGPSVARAMLDHFEGPKKLWTVIEKYPDRLAEVRGITAERAVEIHAAYARHAYDRDRMIKFRSWGMTENQIARMVRVWGDDSEARLRDNPYQLADLIDGFGFLRSDAIAQRMGMPRNAEPRIRCGLLHTMKLANGHGHCYIPQGKLLALATTKVLQLQDKAELVRKELNAMRRSGEFVVRGVQASGKKANEGDMVEAVYAADVDSAERHCAEMLSKLLKQKDRNQ